MQVSTVLVLVQTSGQVIDSEKTAALAGQAGDAACGVVDSTFVTPRDSNSASNREPVLTTHGENSNTSNSTGHLNSTDNDNTVCQYVFTRVICCQ